MSKKKLNLKLNSLPRITRQIPKKLMSSKKNCSVPQEPNPNGSTIVSMNYKKHKIKCKTSKLDSTTKLPKNIKKLRKLWSNTMVLTSRLQSLVKTPI